MNLKINLCFLTLMLFNTLSCNSQTKGKPSTIVGGGCEGCVAIFEYGNKPLRSIDTLPLFESNEPKLKIVGTVYKKDGKTPAQRLFKKEFSNLFEFILDNVTDLRKPRKRKVSL